MNPIKLQKKCKNQQKNGLNPLILLTLATTAHADNIIYESDPSTGQPPTPAYVTQRHGNRTTVYRSLYGSRMPDLTGPSYTVRDNTDNDYTTPSHREEDDLTKRFATPSALWDD